MKCRTCGKDVANDQCRDCLIGAHVCESTESVLTDVRYAVKQLAGLREGGTRSHSPGQVEDRIQRALDALERALEALSDASE